MNSGTEEKEERERLKIVSSLLTMQREDGEKDNVKIKKEFISPPTSVSGKGGKDNVEKRLLLL